MFFSDVIKLLVVETNQYYYQYQDKLGEVPSLIPDKFLFLAVIMHMGHDI